MPVCGVTRTFKPQNPILSAARPVERTTSIQLGIAAGLLSTRQENNSLCLPGVLCIQVRLRAAAQNSSSVQKEQRARVLVVPTNATTLTTSAMLARGAATSSMSFLCCGILKSPSSLRVYKPHARAKPELQQVTTGARAWSTKPRTAYAVSFGSHKRHPLDCRHRPIAWRKIVGLTTAHLSSDGVGRRG